jgi:hypothetical protein
VHWWTTASAFSVEGGFAPIALDVHLQDRGVVHEAVYGRQRHSLIGEDATPLTEWLIGRYEQRSTLVTCSNQLEQHAGLRLILCDVGDIVEDQEVVAIELVIALSSVSSRRATCSRCTRSVAREQNAPPVLDERKADRRAQAHAMQAARHTMAKAILEGERLGLTRIFQVEDEHGNTVREVPFRDAVVLDRVSEGPRSS